MVDKNKYNKKLSKETKIYTDFLFSLLTVLKKTKYTEKYSVNFDSNVINDYYFKLKNNNISNMKELEIITEYIKSIMIYLSTVAEHILKYDMSPYAFMSILNTYFQFIDKENNNVNTGSYISKEIESVNGIALNNKSYNIENKI